MEESRMDGQRPTLTRGTEIYAHSTRIKQIPFILFINAHNSEPPKRVVPARTGAPLLPGRLLWFYRLPTHQVDNNETETTSKHLTVFSFHSADIDRVACWTAWASAFLIENSFKQKKKNSQPMLVTWKKKWFKHQGLTLYRTLYKRLQKETLDEGRLEGGRKTVCVPTICCPVASAAFHFWWSHHARLPGDAFGGPNS